MIGQRKNLAYLANLAEPPHFLIVFGARGSGRKTLIREAYKAHGLEPMAIDGKVDALRSAIDIAVSGNGRFAFLIDSDDFSNTSAGALLKITEECPSNAWFALIAPSRQEVLQTLQSRATILDMEPYSKEEYLEYSKSLGQSYNLSEEDVAMAYEYCETFGDAFRLMTGHGRRLVEFAEKIVAHVSEVTLANALKIPQSIDTKGTDPSKFPMDLVLGAVLRISGKSQAEGAKRVMEATTWALGLLRNKSMSKHMLIDAWVLQMKGVCQWN